MKYLCLALALLAGSAQAATATAVLNSTAQLNGACTISTGAVNFGAWIPDAPALAGSDASQVVTNTVRVLCNNKLAYTLQGKQPIAKGTAIGLFMKGATSTDEIVYNVLDGVWGSGGRWFGDGGSTANGKTNVITGTGTGAQQNINLYFYLYNAAVYPKRWVKPDTYTDNYTLTLTY
jgi:spore coat protein U-like protein